MCLVEQTIMTGEIRMITHYSYAVLGRPALHGDQIFPTAGLATVDQVYAEIATTVFYQVWWTFLTLILYGILSTMTWYVQNTGWMVKNWFGSLAIHVNGMWSTSKMA
jgi:hypothetical protein